MLTGEDFVTTDSFTDAIVAARKQCADFPNHDDLVVPDNGRLGALTRWLLGKGINKDRAKQLVNSVKNELFTVLKPSQLLPAYYTMLSSLSEKLPK